MLFIQREFVVENKLFVLRTSGETYVRFRLKLKITSVESTYPSQRRDCPSLSPYFLLLLLICRWLLLLFVFCLLDCFIVFLFVCLGHSM